MFTIENANGKAVDGNNRQFTNLIEDFGNKIQGIK